MQKKIANLPSKKAFLKNGNFSTFKRRVPQTVNRKRPFTRRSEHRPKNEPSMGGGSKKRRFSKKAFLKNGESEKAKKFLIFAKNSIFHASTATGWALVSGVLAPMGASKMPFLAKFGNYYHFRNYFPLWRITIISKDTFLEIARFRNTFLASCTPPRELKRHFSSNRLSKGAFYT